MYNETLLVSILDEFSSPTLLEMFYFKRDSEETERYHLNRGVDITLV